MQFCKLVGLFAATAMVSTVALAKGPVQRTQVTGSLLPVVARSTVVGIPRQAETIFLSIGLEPRYPAELQAFCDSVSNPSSPNYQHFMSPEQVGETFGASATDVDAVVKFLKSQGIKVSLVSPNRMAILASGTVAQAEAAFATKIKQYRGPDDSGKLFTFKANSTPITMPAPVAKAVQWVAGLNDFARPIPRTTLSPSLARTLYNTAPSYANGFTGLGRKIGISNWDNFRLADTNVFYSNFGLPTPSGGLGSNVHVVVIGAAHNTTTAGPEGNLDIQMACSAAPLADVYVYDNNGNDLLGVLAREVSDNLADVISESYGWTGVTGGFSTSVHNQHLSMTAQGQSYLCASGDNGTSDLSNTPYPDSDPDVTSVGGTIATVNGSGVRTSEVAWSGSGGGWSTQALAFNVHPSWQVGTGVPVGNNHRLVPDVAMHAASGSGAFFIIFNGGLNGISGTSCSSPYFASSLATMQQRLAALGLTSRLGRMNDMIYAENGRSDVWFDIISGSGNGNLPDATSSVPHAAWDFCTGFGAPNFDAWYTVLSTRNVSGTVTLQNYSGTVAGTSVTVQLYNAGTSTLVDTKVTTLDAAGNFTVSSQAPGGNYDIYVKASHWLRRKTLNKSFMNAGVSGLTFSLINGDVNGDNGITLGDFAALRAAFGSTPVDPNWNANADLNGDGAVSLGDFATLRANFGLSGD